LKEHRTIVQMMPVCVRANKMGIKRARVTAVDINAHEIVE